MNDDLSTVETETKPNPAEVVQQQADTLYGEAQPQDTVTEVAKPEPVEEASSDEPKPRWTDDDVSNLTTIKTEAEAFQRDLEVFAAVKEKLAQNPDKARELKGDLEAAEAELRKRHETLTNAAQTYQARDREQLLSREEQKLVKAVPDLAQEHAKEALRTYLTKTYKFPADQVKATDDHRLVEIAWKAMQYDKMTGGKKPQGKVVSRRSIKRDKSPKKPVPSLRQNANVFERNAALDVLYPNSK